MDVQRLGERGLRHAVHLDPAVLPIHQQVRPRLDFTVRARRDVVQGCARAPARDDGHVDALLGEARDCRARGGRRAGLDRLTAGAIRGHVLDSTVVDV